MVRFCSGTGMRGGLNRAEKGVDGAVGFVGMMCRRNCVLDV